MGQNQGLVNNFSLSK